MFSATRCPALSDELKKWSESRAAAPKDQCPVGHRGEFPDFLRGNISGLRLRLLRADLRSGGQILGLKSRF